MAKKPDPAEVFLNIPYDRAYETLVVAMLTTLVFLGRKPILGMTIPDGGQGRLRKVFDLLQRCSASIHDLSRSRGRLNMPLEAGLALGVRFGRRPPRHFVLVMHRDRAAFDRTCSDLKGVDAKFHNGRALDLIQGVLAELGRPDGRPSFDEVVRAFRRVGRRRNGIKRRFHVKDLFDSVLALQGIVREAVFIARDMGVLAP